MKNWTPPQFIQMENKMNPNTDVIISEAEQNVFEYIYRHLVDVSFGEKICNDASYCSALTLAIPQMMSSIKTNPSKCNIKVSYIIGTKLLPNVGKRLKKDDERRICFETAYIMLLMALPSSNDIIITSESELLEKYPEFKCLGQDEKSALLAFRNALVVSTTVITPSYNKSRLIDVATRIAEGKSKKYITGSGQTTATSNRVLIYERETGWLPKPRAPRKSASKECKRKISSLEAQSPELTKKRRASDTLETEGDTAISTPNEDVETEKVKALNPTIFPVGIRPRSQSLNSDFSLFDESVSSDPTNFTSPSSENKSTVLPIASGEDNADTEDDNITTQLLFLHQIREDELCDAFICHPFAIQDVIASPLMEASNYPLAKLFELPDSYSSQVFGGSDSYSSQIFGGSDADSCDQKNIEVTLDEAENLSPVYSDNSDSSINKR